MVRVDFQDLIRRSRSAALERKACGSDQTSDHGPFLWVNFPKCPLPAGSFVLAKAPIKVVGVSDVESTTERLEGSWSRTG